MAIRDQNETEGIDAKTILLSIVCSLALSPITFQLTSNTVGSLQSGLLASIILTLTLFLILVYSIQNNLIKQSCPIDSRLIRDYKPLKNIFKVFYKDEVNVSAIPQEKTSPNKRKINPKYFKPKFIYYELMSMWGTTYTVITWGSVWIIGGTLVATERLANKIKTKCTREQQPDLPNSNRGTGRNSSFASYNSSFSSSDSVTSSSSGRNSFKRIRSWTKRTYSAAKKKFNKFTGVGVLQLTHTAAPANGTNEAN